MNNQLNMYEFILPKYKITKPIRLIEFFAGYGSQALALKYLGVEFEHWKICEWAIKSIQAYKDIHFKNDNTDYSKDLSIEEIKKYLFNKGISSNYNEPMNKQQINRLTEEQARKIYNNIKATHNLVNIQQVKGKDLEITDTNKYDYILTYSFPCQDLSLAGKGKGMSDTSTRSGMLWEVERILDECKELGTLPQILLMENVPQVHGADNVKDFNKWQLKLQELGYSSYWEDLIATDYGIPQTRNRCFMISILGDYSYTFPQKQELKLKLKDMLEDNVDEKYYLSDAMIKCFTRETDDNKFPRGDRFKQALKLTNEKNLAGTITTAAGNRATDNFILTKDTENYIEWEDGKNIQMNCRAWKEDKVIATLNTGGETKILIKNATKKGYLEATDGDGVDISSRMEHHRGNVQKDKIQTLTTQCDRGVVVKDHNKIGSIYSDERAKCQGGSIYSEENSSPTLSTAHGYGVPFVNKDLKIRKLTPRECFRLMGVKDEDFDKVSKNQSDSSLYHLAGDSICTPCLMALFSQLLDVSWEDKLWNIKNSIKMENT